MEKKTKIILGCSALAGGIAMGFSNASHAPNSGLETMLLASPVLGWSVVEAKDGSQHAKDKSDEFAVSKSVYALHGVASGAAKGAILTVIGYGIGCFARYYLPR